MKNFLNILILCLMLISCTTSPTTRQVIEKANLYTGMTKSQLRIALFTTHLGSDPFLPRCYRQYYPNKEIEVLSSENTKTFFIFRNVSVQDRLCNAHGNGTLAKVKFKPSDVMEFINITPRSANVEIKKNDRINFDGEKYHTKKNYFMKDFKRKLNELNYFEGIYDNRAGIDFLRALINFLYDEGECILADQINDKIDSPLNTINSDEYCMNSHSKSYMALKKIKSIKDLNEILYTFIFNPEFKKLLDNAAKRIR